MLPFLSDGLIRLADFGYKKVLVLEGVLVEFIKSFIKPFDESCAPRDNFLTNEFLVYENVVASLFHQDLLASASFLNFAVQFLIFFTYGL
jgi:hypothetical protein